MAIEKRTENSVPAIVGVSKIDGETPTRIYVNPSTGAVVIEGTIASSTTSPTTIFNGKTTVTTAGTRVVLSVSTTVQSVVIKALSSNTGTIYVGNSSVTSSNGLQLDAGESVALDIANLTTVNIDSSVNGEGVTYLAVN